MRITKVRIFLFLQIHMKTQGQKKAQVEKIQKMLGSSVSALFVDFSGLQGGDIHMLKARLRDIGATISVVPKRLMKIVLRREGIELDPHEQFEGQAATILSQDDISGIAQAAYVFGKESERLKILGGLDIEKKEYITEEDALAIGKLPSRDALIGQVVGSIGSPLSALLHILNGRKEQLT